MNTLRKNFIVVDHDIKHKRVVCINKDGQIVWSYGIDRALDLQLLEHGGCLINSGAYNVEIDANGMERWRYAEEACELISCFRLPNGNTVMGNVTTHRIFEITRDFRKVWEMPFPYEEGEDPHQLFRMIRPLSNGNLLIAWHGQRKLAEFTHQGQSVWEFPLPAGPYEGIELSNGNYLVSVGPAGMIVEISKSAGIVWSFSMEETPGLSKGWVAGIQVMSNGNIVFSDSKGDQIIEINRNKQIVGIFHEPDVLLHPSCIVVLEE